MPSKKYAAPLRLEPRVSSRLRSLLVLSLAGALLLPPLVPAPLWSLPALWFTAALIGVRAWRRHFGHQRIVAVNWDEMGAWQLGFADGGECEAELEGESFVAPEALVLAWRTPVGRRHLVVVSDVLDGETRRRLRVRLRLEGRRRVADEPDSP